MERVTMAMMGAQMNAELRGTKFTYEDFARAAIGAMRDTTDATFGGLYGVEARRQFSDMIDAALAAQTTPGTSRGETT